MTELIEKLIIEGFQRLLKTPPLLFVVITEPEKDEIKKLCDNTKECQTLWKAFTFFGHIVAEDTEGERNTPWDVILTSEDVMQNELYAKIIRSFYKLSQKPYLGIF